MSDALVAKLQAALDQEAEEDSLKSLKKLDQDEDPVGALNPNTIYSGLIPTRVDCNTIFSLSLIFGSNPSQLTTMEGDVDEINTSGTWPQIVLDVVRDP